MTTKVQTSSSPSLSDSEQITNPVRVARLLERLVKRHTLLTVKIPGHPGHYTTSIVDVDSPYVLLDELLPTSGHPLLLAARTLQVTGKLDGIDIRFISTLERVDNQDNMVTYHVSLPGRLEYRQRRLDYRAHIPMAQILRVIIDSSDGTVVEGILHDLSHGGAGLIFPEGPPVVEPGLYHECAIELPDDAWLYCTVELRYSKDIRLHDRQLIGSRFVELGAEQVRIVGRCIIELEREFIRKRAAE